MKYQPDQSIVDYNDWDLATSSVITGDFTTDSLKYGFGPTALRAEDDYDATYGKAQAKIRRRLKKKIMAQAIMGTKAGQWSARKSQELKRQYEAACEKAGLKPYKGSKTKKQQDLSDWSKQKWKTASGKKSSVTGEPYFPAKAVEALKQNNLYAKAKRQKAAATKAGKQNARYSDDIRAVVKRYRSEEEEIDKLLKNASKTYKQYGKTIKKNISLRRRNKITQQIIEILSKSEEPLTTPEITELIPENLWPKTYRSKKLLHRYAYNKYIPVSYLCLQLVREGTLIKAKGGKTLRLNTYQLKDAEMKVLASDELWVTGERPDSDVQSEIAAGYHNDSYGDLGCPACGNIDYFWKTTTSKGTKYRCMMCEYTDDYETVKSQGDITLEKFGLTFFCDICEKEIKAYNKSSLDSHLQKHQKEAVLEAESRDLTGYVYKGRPIKPKDRKDAESVSTQKLLNWINRPQIITESYDFPSEPVRCIYCGSDDITTDGLEADGEGTVTTDVTCEAEGCGAIWRDYFRYVDTEVIVPTSLPPLDSESFAADEQLEIEIEGIDETYGLVPTDPEIFDLAESAFYQYQSRTDLPETFRLPTKPHFTFVSADAFDRSGHVARFRSQTASHIPIIMLSSNAIRESADYYGVPLRTAVATTIWHEIGHILCELWDMEEIYPFETSNEEEEFAESIAESMYFQEPFQNPVELFG
jgi:predicted RNA-binding Zn-ribbon protein involved in translation (DUF1610 family)